MNRMAPEFERKRQKMREQYEENQRQAEEELRQFFRDHAEKIAEEFVEGQNAPVDPELQKWARHLEGGFGGVAND